MDDQKIIEWLLEGDVCIQYQVYRDLLGVDKKELQDRIAYEGWGKMFLSKRKSNCQWGKKFYQPKWTSSHYTLLDLRNLCLSQDNEIVKETIELTLNTCKAYDGGIQLGPSTSIHSDVCVNGMFLNYSSYFKIDAHKLYPVVDSILAEIMPDGAFNCRTTRSGARHSSLHTTLSVLEGITEFQKAGCTYRTDDLHRAKESAEEFVLRHQLFLSDRTGEVINKDFLKFPYPCRWKYDILRGLDYFQFAGSKWDNRMEAAINILQKKRRTDRRWNLYSPHPGQVHFEMEKAGQPSRWNTLRALRLLNHFGIEKTNSV